MMWRFTLRRSLVTLRIMDQGGSSFDMFGFVLRCWQGYHGAFESKIKTCP
jgi:hypothetical protein